MEYVALDYENREHRFSYSYRALKEEYNIIDSYSDEEFLANLADILHTTIFICWIKEIPNEMTLSDYGILHEISHIMAKVESPYNSLDTIRKMWHDICRL